MLVAASNEPKERRMGLLDALLGQVLGGMSQGGRGGMPDLGGLGGGLGGMGGMGDLGSGLPGAQAGRGGSGIGGAGMAALAMIALQLLQRNGGIEGVLGKMRQQGHAREADSWVSQGNNEPISPDILSDLLGGRDQIGQVSRQMGVDPQDAAGGLASMFPEIINQMTPQGRVESDSNDVVEQALRTLRERQGR
jgi:uncharacterized protein YidB (DUF937 family)